MTPTPPSLAEMYDRSRQRLTELVSALPDAKAVPVPACPAWTVHDLVGHLVYVAEQVVAGTLTGPPSDEETAAQIGRWSESSTSDVLAAWDRAAPGLEQMLETRPIWPAVMDVFSHEQDARGATGRPGFRDDPDLVLLSRMILSALKPPVPITVRCDGEVIRCSPSAPPTATGAPAAGAPPSTAPSALHDQARTAPPPAAQDQPVASAPSGNDDSGLTLDTDWFEAFRFRFGRRSRRQLEGMRWTGDPSPVIDALTIFGPSPLDIIE